MEKEELGSMMPFMLLFFAVALIALLRTRAHWHGSQVPHLSKAIVAAKQMRSGGMKKDEMQSMMHELMGEMFATMSSDEKIELLMGMMGKMKEQGQSEGTARDPSGKEGPGSMKEMMAQMMKGGKEQEAAMPEMMLKGMMPHCVTMMMPNVAKEKRADIASDLIGTLVEQASKDMSNKDRAAFRSKVSKTINT